MEFFEYYKIIHNEFFALLEELKGQIINNNCVLLQFDDKIEYIFMMKLIYISRLTEACDRSCRREKKGRAFFREVRGKKLEIRKLLS